MVQCEQTHSTYAVPRDIWYTINYVESRNPSHFSSIGITNDTGGSNEQCDLAISECSQVRLKKHNHGENLRAWLYTIARRKAADVGGARHLAGLALHRGVASRVFGKTC